MNVGLGKALTSAAITVVLFVASLQPAGSRDLTPQLRSLIFGVPGSVSLAEEPTTIGLDQTDSRGYYKCPYVRAYVNGHGPFTLLIDTGSSHSVLSTRVINAAKLPIVFHRGGYHDVVHVKNIRVETLQIGDLYAVRDDNFDVDGILGFHAFGEKNLTFELAKRRLLVSSSPLQLTHGFTLPYALDHNVPVIQINAGTRAISTLIDTGDDAYAWEARSEDVRGLGMAHAPYPAFYVQQGGVREATLVTTLSEPLRLGDVSSEYPVIGINDALPVPDIGCDLIAQFNVEFIPSSMQVVFEPLFSGKSITIRGEYTPGFSLRFDATRTVSGVVPNSAADKAQMKAGDKILTINGIDVAQYGPKNWDRTMSETKSVTVRWLRGTEVRLDAFPIVELR